MRNVRKDVLTKSETHTITGRKNKMKTIRTKVYQFNELTEKAKQQAINDYRNNGIDTDYIYDDAHNTVKEFN